MSQTCTEQIDALAERKQGWNSYDAPPISAEARERAKAIAGLIMSGPPRVGASPSGSVVLVWSDGADHDFHLDIDGGDGCAGFLDAL